MCRLKVRFSQSSQRRGVFNYALKVEVTDATGIPSKIFVYHQSPAGVEGNTFAEFDHIATPVDFQEIPEDAASETVPWYRTDKCIVWFRNVSDQVLAKQLFVDDINALTRTYNVLTSENGFRRQASVEFSENGVHEAYSDDEDTIQKEIEAMKKDISGKVSKDAMSGVEVETNTTEGIRNAVQQIGNTLGARIVNTVMLALSVLSIGASALGAGFSGEHFAQIDLDENPVVVTNVTFDGLATLVDITNVVDSISTNFVPALRKEIADASEAGTNYVDSATNLLSAAIDKKYDKQADGIPKGDLSAGVQASLDKADTAVQPAALSGYKPIQEPVGNPPESSSTAYNFVSAITQDVNGVIYATRRRIPTTTNWNTSSGDGSATDALTQRGIGNFRKTVVCDEWYPGTNYLEGAFVLMRSESKCYICTNAHVSASLWTAEESWNWSEATVADVLAALCTGKANRAANPTAGNLAALDANGNPTDSGKKDADFVHRSGVETISGAKTFSDAITVGQRAGSVGTQSLANGFNVTASYPWSHAEGNYTKATKNYSHAEGDNTQVSNAGEHAEGKFNLSHTGSTLSEKTQHSIGCGTSETNRKNAVETMQDGKTYFLDVGGYDGTNPGSEGVKDLASAISDKADAETVESLRFPQYYPDGSVKSAAEFTPGIKYDTPDTTNRTITVKPFCNVDGTAENDNSNLSGRVVIPPFVDAQGNPYISDDSTRFKVVEVGSSGNWPNANNTNLTVVIVPTTVTTVGNSAFNGCAYLASVSLPSATGIGNSAFQGCTRLAAVSLPLATGVGNSGFNGCTSLASVSLPSVTTVGSYAFRDCRSLALASLPSVMTVAAYAFDNCTSLASVSLPLATGIGNGAFSRCGSLASVSLPSATSPGLSAFKSCTSLASVSLPSAKTIWDDAFEGCTALTSVSLPAVTTVRGYAFESCTNLTSVDFGDTPHPSVPTLGAEAFNGVTNTCKIIVPDAQYDAWTAETLPDESPNPWYDLVAAGYKFLKHSEWEYARKYETVPDSRTVNGKALTNDVTLTGADIAVSGTDATKISDALAGKANDADVIHNTGNETKAGSLTIFSEEGYGSVGVMDVNQEDGTVKASLLGANKMAYMEGTVAYVYTFPSSSGAFAIAASNPTAGNLAALNAAGNPTDSGLSKDEVESLLFAKYYPEGNVKSAAEFTQGIKYNDPDTTNRTITVKPFCNTGDSDNDNSSLVGRVVIPPFVDAHGNGYISDDATRFKVVGVSGFYGLVDPNTKLTAFAMPSTVTTIGNQAFFYCLALTTVSLPTATTIGEAVFYDCTALTSVSLPAATTIEVHAFASCTSLTSVDFGDTPRSSVPTLGTNAFNGVPTTCKIIVPYTQYDAWIAADGWRDLPQEFVRHAEKADKPATFTAGNLAALDSDGNPTDSGIAKINVLTKGTLSGETMPSSPTQNELAEAVKKIFTALGGTVTP